MKKIQILGLCGGFAIASMACGQALLVPNSSPDELWALGSGHG
ncbi:MAG: hypothetical protein ACOC0P_07755 [Planctomycetota bacterium]